MTPIHTCVKFIAASIFFLACYIIPLKAQTPNIHSQVGYSVGTSSNATAYGNSTYLVQGGFS